MQDALAGAINRAGRHQQGIDHHVGRRNTMIGGAPDDLFRHLETLIGIFRNAGLVIGDGDHGGAMLFDQGQHGFQHLVLAGHGINQGPAFISLQPRFQGRDDGTVDGQRRIRDRLHKADGGGQNSRLVRHGDAGIDIQHVGAGGDLGQRIGLDPGKIARRHFRRQQLAPGRVDALANDHEGAVEADRNLPVGRTDDGFGHAVSLSGSADLTNPARSPYPVKRYS